MSEAQRLIGLALTESLLKRGQLTPKSSEFVKRIITEQADVEWDCPFLFILFRLLQKSPPTTVAILHTMFDSKDGNNNSGTFNLGG